MSRREEVLSKIGSVQLMPPAALEVVRLLQESDVSIASLTRTIEYDPGLTSNVLRLANSAYFGCSYQVGSVRDAIFRLGTKSIFRLVMAAGFSSVAQRGIRGYDLAPGHFWEHSMAVALGVGRLASALGIEVREDLFTSGILHDIGKIVLGTYLEVDASPILAMAVEERVSFEVAEQRVLGIDHAEVGALLFKGWNLPSETVEAVRWHHQPSGLGKISLEVDLVHLTDALCIMNGIATGVEGLYYKADKECVARLSLKNSIAEEVSCHMVSDLKEMLSTFGLGTGMQSGG